MNKIILTLILFPFFFISTAQISLDTIYLNSAYKFYYINLGNGVYNYLRIDTNNFTLYNLDHSVNISGFFPVVQTTPIKYKAQFFTNSLFDCDSSNIEYILFEWDCTVPICIYNTKIYRTDGTLLFSQDSVSGVLSMGGPGIFSSYINNTPLGTKMILEHYNKDVFIYNLCDSLPTNYFFLQNDQEPSYMNAFPNPASKYTIVKYKLPENAENATLVFYNQNGVEVKRFLVDKTFDHLRISTDDLPSGIYYYQINSSAGASEGKKLIKIH